jgi:hypothetical protein
MKPSPLAGSCSGFLLLYALAKLKPLRRRSLRPRPLLPPADEPA